MSIELLTTTSHTVGNVIGALIIVLGSILAVIRFIRGLFEKHTKNEVIAKRHIDPVRVELGRYINFGLEFIVAADILTTMFAPTWSEIGQLLVLVLIRTLISFFLIFEIRKVEERSSQN